MGTNSRSAQSTLPVALKPSLVSLREEVVFSFVFCDFCGGLGTRQLHRHGKASADVAVGCLIRDGSNLGDVLCEIRLHLHLPTIKTRKHSAVSGKSVIYAFHSSNYLPAFKALLKYQYDCMFPELYFHWTQITCRSIAFCVSAH